MGTYNTLRTEMTCPHCSTLVHVEIELFFGDTRTMEKFEMGDLYKWVPNKSEQHGGRPDDGNTNGKGYTECPQCGRDFFVKVMVREDRIQGVEPDMEKDAYIQSAGVNTTPILDEITRRSGVNPGWKPGPRIRETGRITYNEKWKLTASIQETLEQLIKYGVDIYSSVGGSDYTILVPLDLSREQLEEVDRLMSMLGKEVKGKVNFVDWHPHGWKFRIEPPGEHA